MPDVKNSKELFKDENGKVVRKPKEEKKCPFAYDIAEYVKKASLKYDSYELFMPNNE